MSEPQIPEPNSTKKTPPSIGGAGLKHRLHSPNPPESFNPDAATLRDQWRFAIRQYSRWYSQAWGTAILAGLSFFALGWVIKGSNPLPSFKPDPVKDSDSSSSESPSSSKASAQHSP